MFSLNKLNFRKKYIEMPQKKTWTFFDTFTLEKLSSYSLSHALFQLNMQKILIFDVQTKERVELPPLKKYFSSFLVSLSDWYFNITRVGQWLRSQIPEDPGSNAITVIEKLFTACKKRRKRCRGRPIFEFKSVLNWPLCRQSFRWSSSCTSASGGPGTSTGCRWWASRPSRAKSSRADRVRGPSRAGWCCARLQPTLHLETGFKTGFWIEFEIGSI